MHRAESGSHFHYSAKVPFLRVVHQGKDHAVKIIKEAEQIETELDEAFLLVLSQCTKDLCRVKHVLSIHDLVGVVCDKREVPGRGDPLSADQEDKRHKRLHKHFWQNKLVQLVTELDRVDVVHLEIANQDDEKDLDEQESGANDDAEQKDHGLCRHCDV